MRNEEQPYFHIEWIMDNVFKLTPEEKAENERYWARDNNKGVGSADGVEGFEGEGGAPMDGGPGDTDDSAIDDGGDDLDIGGTDDPSPDTGGGDEFEF
jgi:hypothetical protein